MPWARAEQIGIWTEARHEHRADLFRMPGHIFRPLEYLMDRPASHGFPPI